MTCCDFYFSLREMNQRNVFESKTNFCERGRASVQIRSHSMEKKRVQIWRCRVNRNPLNDIMVVPYLTFYWIRFNGH